MTTTQEEARIAAQQTILNFWPDGQYPVNPYAIAQSMGVIVKFIRLPSDKAGGLLKEIDEIPIIFINNKDNSNRQRFTCAHELGHYIKNAAQKKYEYYDNRDIMSTLGTSPDEVFANSFAANLLLPEKLLREKLNDLKRTNSPEISLIVAANLFGVSVEALNFRLKNLNIV